MKLIKKYLKGIIVSFSVMAILNINLNVKAYEGVRENNIVTNNAYNELPQSSKAIKNGNFKIAFVGDSITEGANLFDLNNNYVKLVEDKLKLEMPEIKIEVKNFSLGGRGTRHFVDDYYKANEVETDYNINFNRPWCQPGLSWKKHVEEFQPDLMIVAFGMNDAFGIKNSDALFYDNLKKITDDTKKWRVNPDLFFVTNILPTKDMKKYNQRQDISNEVALVTRSFAKENGYMYGDANAIFQLLRDGKDIKKLTTQTHGQADSVDNFLNGKIEFDASFNAVGEKGGRDIIYRSNDLGSVIIRLEANNNDTGIASVFFSDTNTLFDKELSQINKTITNKTDSQGNNITIIKNEKDNELSPYKKVSIPNLKLNTTYRIKIDVNDIYHNLYINDNPILGITAYKKLAPGKILIRGNGKDAFSLNNLNITSLQTEQTTPIYSEEELIGKFNDPTSEGNGINHPTTLGHKKIYLPCFDELIDKLSKVYRNR